MAQIQAKLEGGNSREHLHFFLEKYFLCEIASKEMLVGYQNEIGEHLEYKDAKMDLRKLKPAFNHYGLGLSNDVLKRLFAAKTPKGQRRSAKNLRDSVVHGMTRQNLAEIDSRYSQLISDMEVFINSVKR